MKLALVILAVIALPAGVWMASDRPEPAGHLNAPSSRSPASSFSSAEPFDIRFQPEEGQRYTYSFQRKIRIRGLGNKIPDIAYRGELRLDILEAGAGGFTAVASESIEGQAANQVLLKARVEKRGQRLELFSAAPDSEEEQQHEAVLKDLLSQLIFPLRSDTVGPYEATLEEVSAEEDFVRFRKVKRGYLSGKHLPEIVSSLHLLKWNVEAGMPEEVRGAEATRLGQGETGISSDSSYLLQLKTVSAAPKRKRSELAALKLSESLVLSGKAALRQHPDSLKLSWPEMLERLRKLGSLSPSDRLQAFGDLVKLLELQGGNIPALLNLLRSEDAVRLGASSPVFQAVVGALATAGGPEALAALRELYQDPLCPVSGKGAILAALTTTQAPLDQDTRGFLLDTMEGEPNRDLSLGAAFALGSSLENIPSGDKQAGESIVRLLNAWEQTRSGTLQEQLAMLDAIGNSGRQEFLPALSGIIQGSSGSELRAKAVFSLRFVKTEEAHRLLAGSLFDPDPQVRTGAVSAIGLATWTETFRAPVEKCSLEEEVGQIRSACQKLQQTVAKASH
jgi:HEAT repeat protein